MDPLNKFKIPYVGLKVGKHQYRIEIGKTFFDEFEYPELENGQLVATLELNKQETMITIDSHIEGKIFTSCDRCNDEIKVGVYSDQTLFVKFGGETIFETEDILMLAPSEDKIDLAEYFFQNLVINLPSKRTHKTESDCNQEVLKYLNYQETEETTGTNEEIDPRWLALKGLK